MKLLVQPPPLDDESLESYLLRLSNDNLFSTYQQLSYEVWNHIHESDYEASGAFPRDLASVNVYHASVTSNFRVRAIKIFESCAEIDKLPLLSKAVLHSNLKFGKKLSSVTYRGTIIPLCFLRQNSIPICPKCLTDESYIRQNWHLSPYSACHKHECELLSHCPECHTELNYQATELINYCCCGFDLRDAHTPEVNSQSLQLSKLLTQETVRGGIYGRLYELSLSQRYGALLWFYKKNHPRLSNFVNDNQDLVQAIDYFSNWPANYHQELKQMQSDGQLMQIKPFNKTAFKQIFGDLLLDCRQLPFRDRNENFILNDTIQFLEKLVDDNPKTKQPNIADCLLTLLEVATILSTTHEQVKRLYKDGYLTLSFQLSKCETLEPYQPGFYLREVTELLASGIQGSLGRFTNYVPAW